MRHFDLVKLLVTHLGFNIDALSADVKILCSTNQLFGLAKAIHDRVSEDVREAAQLKPKDEDPPYC